MARRVRTASTSRPFDLCAHLRHSGVGTVGADDEVELIVLLDAFLGALRVARVVDLVLAAVLVGGNVDRRHECIHRVGTLSRKKNEGTCEVFRINQSQPFRSVQRGDASETRVVASMAL